jgi:hypothetical protein
MRRAISEITDDFFRDLPEAERKPPTDEFVDELAHHARDQAELDLLASRRNAIGHDLSFVGEAARNQKQRDLAGELVTALHLGASFGDLQLLGHQQTLSISMKIRVAYISTLYDISGLSKSVAHIFRAARFHHAKPRPKSFTTFLLGLVATLFANYNIDVDPVTFAGMHFTRDLAFLLEAAPWAFEQAYCVDHLLARDFKKHLKTGLLKGQDANALNDFLARRLAYLDEGQASAALPSKLLLH